jgi:hypothetical protein
MDPDKTHAAWLFDFQQRSPKFVHIYMYMYVRKERENMVIVVVLSEWTSGTQERKGE